MSRATLGAATIKEGGLIRGQNPAFAERLGLKRSLAICVDCADEDCAVARGRVLWGVGCLQLVT